MGSIPSKVLLDKAAESTAPLNERTNDISISGSSKSLQQLVSSASPYVNPQYIESLLMRLSDSPTELPSRLNILLGSPPKDGLTAHRQKKESIPSKPNESNKSIWNKERYKFFLLAPFNVSNRCCHVMKKQIAKKFAKDFDMHPITAQMASESKLRTTQWLNHQCNGFDMKQPISNPMSFWFDADVLEYAALNDIKLASVYGDIVADGVVAGQMNFVDCFNSEDLGIFDAGKKIFKTTGCQRTGCFACGFGLHREKEENSRLSMIQRYSNPKLLDWIIRGGEFREGDGLWHPKAGLGYWFIMLWCNKYGKMKYWFPNAIEYLKKYSTAETDHYLFPEGRPDFNDPKIHDEYPWIPITTGAYLEK